MISKTVSVERLTLADRLRMIADDSPGHTPNSQFWESCMGCKIESVAKALEADSFLIYEQLNRPEPDLTALREIANHLGEQKYPSR